MNIDHSRYAYSVDNVIDIQIHIHINMYVLYESIYCDGGDGGVGVFNSIQLLLIYRIILSHNDVSLEEC